MLSAKKEAYILQKRPYAQVERSFLMFQSILVPPDGSLLTARALSRAGQPVQTIQHTPVLLRLEKGLGASP
jgi:hypothetical protein